MARLYSFRFPYDIRTVLEPWRTKLRGNPASPVADDSDFEVVVAHMADRDRAIEDHVNYVSQGRLGYATSLSYATLNTTNQTTDLTDLSVTVTVPANRVIRVTGQAAFNNQNDAAGGVNRDLYGVIREGATEHGYFGTINLAINPMPTLFALATIQTGSVILTPTAGEHTYKLTAKTGAVGTGTCRVGGDTVLPAFILVEDIGPVGT